MWSSFLRTVRPAVGSLVTLHLLFKTSQKFKTSQCIVEHKPTKKRTAPSAVKNGTIQRRLARPLRKDDTHKSRSTAPSAIKNGTIQRRSARPVRKDDTHKSSSVNKKRTAPSAIVTILSVNMLADSYIHNHKNELGYIPEWLQADSKVWRIANKEALHDHDIYTEVGKQRAGPWPKERFFPAGFRRGHASNDSSSALAAVNALEEKRGRKFDELQSRIPYQPERIDRLFSQFPRWRAALREQGHYIVGFQELTKASISALQQEKVGLLAGARILSTQEGQGKDDHVCTATNLPLQVVCDAGQPDKKPYMLTSGILELGQIAVKIGVLNVHGSGGEFRDYQDKARYMKNLLQNVMATFEGNLTAQQPGIFIVLGDWNVQWSDEDGLSVFEEPNLSLQHYSPPMGSQSMYAHEYGNAGTVIDHIAWKPYGKVAVQIVPESSFVEDHKTFVNAPILFGYWHEPAPLEECVSDHAPVGVKLRVTLKT